MALLYVFSRRGTIPGALLFFVSNAPHTLSTYLPIIYVAALLSLITIIMTSL